MSTFNIQYLLNYVSRNTVVKRSSVPSERDPFLRGIPDPREKGFDPRKTPSFLRKSCLNVVKATGSSLNYSGVYGMDDFVRASIKR